MAKAENPKAVEGDNSGALDSGHLRAFIERVERLEEEKRTISDDIKQVFAEAKGNGYDTKIMKKVISRRRLDRYQRAEEDALLDLYESIFG